MRNLIKNSSIDFIGRQREAMILSSALIVISLLAILIRGMNLGVDFTGGYTIEVGYEQAPNLETIRGAMAEAEMPDSQVQTFGKSTDVLIRMAPREDLSSADVSTEVLRVLDSVSDSPISIRRVEFVGPQVGEELREKGGIAVLTALFFIVVYILSLIHI